MPFLFGVSRRKLTPSATRVVARVAQSLGVDFIESHDAKGNGYRRYFEAPNRGAPFDRELELAVLGAVKAAGVEL